MGVGLRVGDLTPKKEEFVPYYKRFEEAFPYYLSIGMTAEQYWDDDVELCKFYRKKAMIDLDRENQSLWLQGMYIYEALLRVSPAFNALSKKKPEPYMEKPYEFKGVEKNKEKAADQQEKKLNENYDKLTAWMRSVNNNFLNGKEVKQDGRDG